MMGGILNGKWSKSISMVKRTTGSFLGPIANFAGVSNV
ncbi:hypothetical protein bmyco0003_11770 [Bacillus pseudomycoides]|nr:hypothetical protein bmyco0003_11770 [Bacillus pseudomycoides]